MRVRSVLTLVVVHSFATVSSATSLAFHLTPQGGIIVPVSVNGTAPAPFFLDTGANRSLISSALADALGLQAAASTTIVTAAGTRDALVTKVDRLGMNGVTVEGLVITVVPPDAFSLPDVVAGGEKVVGLIGQDVLAALRYTIDYRKQQIVWHQVDDQIPRRADSHALALEPEDDRFVVVLPQANHVLRLVPDSGADRLVIYRRRGVLPDLALTPGPAVGLTSVAGSRTVRLAVLRALRVGTAVLRDVGAVLVDRDCAQLRPDGLLPLHLFGRVTFNGPSRQLYVETR